MRDFTLVELFLLFNTVPNQLLRSQKGQKVKSSMFDRMVNQITTTAATTGPNTPSAQAAAALMRFGVINPDRNSDKSSEEPLREEDGILSIDVAERMLQWHAEAIGRCVELSPPNDV